MSAPHYHPQKSDLPPSVNGDEQLEAPALTRNGGGAGQTLEVGGEESAAAAASMPKEEVEEEKSGSTCHHQGFRSVLPHEPPPPPPPHRGGRGRRRGYVLLQGNFLRPLRKKKKKKKKKSKSDRNIDTSPRDRNTEGDGDQYNNSTSSGVTACEGHCEKIDSSSSTTGHFNGPCSEESRRGRDDDDEASRGDQRVEIIEATLRHFFQQGGRGRSAASLPPAPPPPHSQSCLSVWADPRSLTRARLTYATWHEARDVATYCKFYKVAPSTMMVSRGDSMDGGGEEESSTPSSSSSSYSSSKPLQVTQVTDEALPAAESCWQYVSPPKFRRLLLTSTPKDEADRAKVDEASLLLERQKCTTRFVYLSGLGGAAAKLMERMRGIVATSSKSCGFSEADVDVNYVSGCVMVSAVREMVLSCLAGEAVSDEGIDGIHDDASAGKEQNGNEAGGPPAAGGGGALRVEVWLPQWNKKNKSCTHCYLGMSSHRDASTLIRLLCGAQNIGLTFRVPSWLLAPSSTVKRPDPVWTVQTGRLFLDYADVTRRCYRDNKKKAKHPILREDGSRLEVESDGISSHGPPRSECTSTTSSVHVPGLVLVPDYISPSEEDVLTASLTGPEAPWAPDQSRPSHGGYVKRRVQHYGYVFDYASADVLRDRDNGGIDAACPPMPAIQLQLDGEKSAKIETKDRLEGAGTESVGVDTCFENVSSMTSADVEAYIANAVSDLRGWDVLAGIIERTRRYHFDCSTAATCPDADLADLSGTLEADDQRSIKEEEGQKQAFDTQRKHYPHINQMTVNEYVPGQGIGSHIDTPSAFGDGLISITLNGGCVMEFRERSLSSEEGTPPVTDLKSQELCDEGECNVHPAPSADGKPFQTNGSGTFTNRNQRNTPESRRKLLYLAPRSLLLMSGAARYRWEHMIVSRATDTVDGKVIPRKVRISLTLRTALQQPNQNYGTEKDNAYSRVPRRVSPVDISDNSEALTPDLQSPRATLSPSTEVQPLPRVESSAFPPKWGGAHDTAGQSNRVPETSLSSHFITPSCEKQHVHKVYDAIAEQWHHTRGKRGVLWPGATSFMTNLPRGSIVADVGCGDGKYFAAGYVAGCYVIGTDISEPLLRTAMGGTGGGKDPRQVRYDESGASARPAVAVADCMNLPMRNESCDAAICIAVMHHISTVERRLQCLRELRRVVKVGGMINVQAWALEQREGSRHKFAGTDVFVPFNAQPRYLKKVNNIARSRSDPEMNHPASSSMSLTQNGCGNGLSGDTEKEDVAAMYSEAYEGADYDSNKGLVVFRRYCHVYREGELDALVARVNGLEILQSGYESGNHYIIAKATEYS